MAQVTAGGVSTKEIIQGTLESTLLEGLYVVGELLDVDGTCGGYNLQWALDVYKRQGYQTERFLNLCAKNHLVLWELKPVSDGYVFFIRRS